MWRTGGLWLGNREHADTTAVLYLPTVAGSFVTAAVAAAFGAQDWGQLAFGAGLFSWLALESVFIHRLLTAESLPESLRPTLGIQLAPAPVGAIAYVSVDPAASDIVVSALMGYGLLQALVLLRLLPWIYKSALASSHWAFTLGATALAFVPLKLIECGGAGALTELAPYLFLAANALVILVAMGTLKLALRGQLAPKQSVLLFKQTGSMPVT
jgi:tellurite resistance protein